MVELPYLQYGFVLSVYEIVSFWVLVASIPNGKRLKIICFLLVYDYDYDDVLKLPLTQAGLYLGAPPPPGNCIENKIRL